ncbi:MAG: hypothetical protein HY052_05210 [Proteobacteria bacterium]|nr:hypothetical protein [Pseudomonadota bacterium]
MKIFFWIMMIAAVVIAVATDMASHHRAVAGTVGTACTGCYAETRTCTNGVLSDPAGTGTYIYSACSGTCSSGVPPSSNCSPPCYY